MDTLNNENHIDKNHIDFLVIGAQKAGTSALNAYLREHNEICTGNKKEIHFFDNEEEFNHQYVDYDKYHSNFSPKSHHKVVGEVTPIYMYWEDSIKRIWKYNPKIKIIIILRNPIERAYSHWQMLSNRGTEINRAVESLSFMNAVTSENERSKEARPHKHRAYSYIDRGFYTQQIKNVWRYFDRSQVLILKNEDLKSNATITLNKIANFLNISAFKDIKEKSVFAGKYIQKMDADTYKYLKNIFYYDIKQLEQLLNWDCSSWYKEKEKKKILFTRNYTSYTEGHQKVFDYFTHSIENHSLIPSIHFSEKTLWNGDNPWTGYFRFITKKYNTNNADILFIAGLDWKILDKDLENKKVIINFIQSIRHTDSDNELYTFLNRRAIRIAVSLEVAEALKRTGIVNGPIYTIENDHRMKDIATDTKRYDFYILGKKNQKLAKALYDVLSSLGYHALVSLKNIPRDDVWENMASSKVSILLPSPKIDEGFYLPALESMKYSDITIVPDCVGNRSFCTDRHNCLMPNYDYEDILERANYAIETLCPDKKLLKQFKENAMETILSHSLEKEKEAFYHILKKEGLIHV